MLIPHQRHAVRRVGRALVASIAVAAPTARGVRRTGGEGGEHRRRRVDRTLARKVAMTILRLQRLRACSHEHAHRLRVSLSPAAARVSLPAQRQGTRGGWRAASRTWLAALCSAVSPSASAREASAPLANL